MAVLYSDAGRWLSGMWPAAQAHPGAWRFCIQMLGGCSVCGLLRWRILADSDRYVGLMRCRMLAGSARYVGLVRCRILVFRVHVPAGVYPLFVAAYEDLCDSA